MRMILYKYSNRIRFRMIPDVERRNPGPLQLGEQQTLGTPG